MNAINHQLNSVMTHDFSRIPASKVPRSRFHRPSGHKTTFNSGFLVPVYLDEVLPNDVIDITSTFFARIATQKFPVMDNLFLDFFWFFCPNRLLWDNWQRFQGERWPFPDSPVDFIIPRINPYPYPGDLVFDVGSLGDYFGLPVGVALPQNTNHSINVLPFRMYNLVWNEWFRDQNLQDSVDVPKDDGPDSQDIYQLLRRNKFHDYFSSCLPWPQKGDAVSLPLGLSAPVFPDVNGRPDFIPFVDYPGTGGPLIQKASSTDVKVGAAIYGTDQALYWGASVDLHADLSQATAATINALREAVTLQQALELDARGGTRYVELLKTRFGAVAPDFRLQRPEYLGGGSERVVVSPIAMTASSTETQPTASLSSYSTVSAHDRVHYTAVEHGYIMCLVNVRADLNYQQRIDRMWQRYTRHDIYEPAFAHLGEQPVYRRELYFASNDAQDDHVFGYQERWAEYRFRNSVISGKFRSIAPGSLDAWHYSPDYTGENPTLSPAWLLDNPAVARTIATPDEPEVLFDSFFDAVYTRVMPLYSVPGLVRF